MNATGLRDQVLRFYKRVDRGTDGNVRECFVFTSEEWGRLDERAATVQVMQKRLQLKLDAAAEVDDMVDVPLTGLVVDTTDGRAWWIRGVNSVRLLRRTTIGVERISDEQFAQLVRYDSPSQLDGAHYIDPAT